MNPICLCIKKIRAKQSLTDTHDACNRKAFPNGQPKNYTFLPRLFA